MIFRDFSWFFGYPHSIYLIPLCKGLFNDIINCCNNLIGWIACTLTCIRYVNRHLVFVVVHSVDLHYILIFIFAQAGAGNNFYKWRSRIWPLNMIKHVSSAFRLCQFTLVNSNHLPCIGFHAVISLRFTVGHIDWQLGSMGTMIDNYYYCRSYIWNCGIWFPLITYSARYYEFRVRIPLDVHWPQNNTNLSSVIVATSLWLLWHALQRPFTPTQLTGLLKVTVQLFRNNNYYFYLSHAVQ